jgi:hypothetical protein
LFPLFLKYKYFLMYNGHRGRDRMVVGCTANCATVPITT